MRKQLYKAYEYSNKLPLSVRRPIKSVLDSIGLIKNITLEADDYIIRYVYNQHVDKQKKRLKSVVFSQTSENIDPSMGISVDIQSLIKGKYTDLSEFIKRYKSGCRGALIVKVGDLRNLDYKVESDRCVSMPFHGQIWLNSDKNDLTRKMRKEILACCGWLVEIKGISIL